MAVAVTFAWRKDGRRHYTDSRTLAMAKEAARLTGVSVYVVQGSYHNGSRSAGTHSGGGALDIRTWDKTTKQREALLKNLRRVGFAAWYRTRAQGFDPHIHAVAIGCKDLHWTAANQVTAYYKGYDGLKYSRPDDGPRFSPIPTWESYKKSQLPDTGGDWFDMASEADLRRIVREELAAEREPSAKRAGQWAGYYTIREKLKRSDGKEFQLWQYVVSGYEGAVKAAQYSWPWENWRGGIENIIRREAGPAVWSFKLKNSVYGGESKSGDVLRAAHRAATVAGDLWPEGGTAPDSAVALKDHEEESK